jgi:hypothetical protein
MSNSFRTRRNTSAALSSVQTSRADRVIRALIVGFDSARDKVTFVIDCHPEAHDLCGPKDLCNRGAYELHAGCRDPSPRNAAQDDNFTGGACFGIDVRFAIDLLCGHGFHLRASHSRRQAQAEEPAKGSLFCP